MNDDDTREEPTRGKLSPRVPGLGQRIKTRMTKLGLKSAEVARYARITPKVLNNYVNGEREPDLSTAARIAAVLRIPLGDLVDPETMFSPRDDEAAVAMQRLQVGWSRLWGHDAALVANFVNFLAVHREDMATGPAIFTGSGEARRQLTSIHQLLIPSILNRFAPARLETHIHVLEGGTWSGISLQYDERLDRTELATELVSLARERLMPIRSDHVRLFRNAETQVVIGVLLEATPRRSDDAQGAVRHRSRPSLTPHRGKSR